MHFAITRRYRLAGSDGPPPGLIAPYPRLYGALAEGAAKSHAVARRLHELLPFDHRRAAEAMLATCRRLSESTARSNAATRLAEDSDLELVTDVASHHAAYLTGNPNTLLAGSTEWSIATLRTFAARCGESASIDDGARAVLTEFEGRGAPAAMRLAATAALAREMETAALEQLRGEFHSELQIRLFGGFTKRLAEIHGYLGDSWRDPRDDYAFTVALAQWESGRAAQRVVACVDRPEEILIARRGIDGGEQIYRGAVFSFAEQSPDAVAHETPGERTLRFTRTLRAAVK